MSSESGVTSVHYEGTATATNTCQVASRVGGEQSGCLDVLQKQARERAEIKHAAMKASRPTRVYSKPKESTQSKKPKRLLSKRELSSKKSAEICRIKGQIYTELLEQRIFEEEKKQEETRLRLKQLVEKSDCLRTQIADFERLKFRRGGEFPSDPSVQISSFDTPIQSFEDNFDGMLNHSLFNVALDPDDVPSFFKNDQLEECGYLSALSSDVYVCAESALYSDCDEHVKTDKIDVANAVEKTDQGVFSPTTIICVSELPEVSPLKQASSIRNFGRNAFSNEYDW